MKMMKNSLKTLVRQEHGKVLILALILFALGALLLTPLLGLMSTGLTAGRIYEDNTWSLYAADAGVEDAVNWLLQGKPVAWPWTVVEEGQEWQRDQGLVVNHHSVSVTVAVQGSPDDHLYRIDSTATNGGSGTKVTAIVNAQPRFQGCFFHDGYTQGQNDSEVKGTVIVVGTVELRNRADLTAEDMYIDGDLHLRENSTLNADVICITGDITLAQGAEINAHIHFLGDNNTITIDQPESYVTGNIWAEGNLTIRIETGSAHVEIYCPDGVYAWGDVYVHLDKRNSRLVGDIYSWGEITIDKGHNQTVYDDCRYYFDGDLWVSDDACAAREDPPFEIPPCPQLPDPEGAVVDAYQIEGYGG